MKLTQALVHKSNQFMLNTTKFHLIYLLFCSATVSNSLRHQMSSAVLLKYRTIIDSLLMTIFNAYIIIRICAVVKVFVFDIDSLVRLRHMVHSIRGFKSFKTSVVIELHRTVAHSMAERRPLTRLNDL